MYRHKFLSDWLREMSNTRAATTTRQHSARNTQREKNSNASKQMKHKWKPKTTTNPIDRNEWIWIKKNWKRKKRVREKNQHTHKHTPRTEERVLMDSPAYAQHNCLYHNERERERENGLYMRLMCLHSAFLSYYNTASFITVEFKNTRSRKPRDRPEINLYCALRFE